MTDWRTVSVDLNRAEIADLIDCIEDRKERLEVMHSEATNEEEQDYCTITLVDLRLLGRKLREAMQ